MQRCTVYHLNVFHLVSKSIRLCTLNIFHTQYTINACDRLIWVWSHSFIILFVFFFSFSLTLLSLVIWLVFFSFKFLFRWMGPWKREYKSSIQLIIRQSDSQRARYRHSGCKRNWKSALKYHQKSTFKHNIARARLWQNAFAFILNDHFVRYAFYIIISVSLSLFLYVCVDLNKLFSLLVHIFTLI